MNIENPEFDASVQQFLNQASVRAFFQIRHGDDVDRSIDHLNRLFAERLRETRHQERRRRRFFNFRSLQRSFYITVSTLLINTLRVIRTITFVIIVVNYFSNFYRFLLVFGEVFTFSDNIFSDILSYVFRNSQTLYNQHILIKSNRNMVHDNSTYISTFKSFFINIIAKNLNYHCFITSPSFHTTFRPKKICIAPELITCGLDSNSLLFKFSFVTQDFFNLSENSLTSIVVAIFFIYALLGDLLCINVLLFLVVNIMKKAFMYKDVYVASARMIGNTFGKMVA